MKNVILLLAIVVGSQSALAGEAQVILTVNRAALWNDRSEQCVVEGQIKFLQQSMLNPVQISEYQMDDNSIQLQMKGKRVSTWSDDAVVCPRPGQEVSGVILEKGRRLILD